MLRSASFYCLAATTLCVLTGCQSGQFPVEKVTGKVTCGGQPVSNVLVYMEPIRTASSSFVGQQGYGLTDANGVFKITTYRDGDGAVLGMHKIRVGKTEKSPACDCGLNADVVIQELEVTKGKLNEFTIILPQKSDPIEAPGTRPAMTEEEIEKAMDAAQ
jgi:hypothetical protein